MSSKKNTVVTPEAVVETVETPVETAASLVEPEVEVEVEITEKKITSDPVTVMYVGPTILHVVQKSTVFKDGKFPEKLNRCIEKAPYMSRLFIPLDSLAEAMKELSKPKSALSVISAKVSKQF